jgi:hypothetical protein
MVTFAREITSGGGSAFLAQSQYGWRSVSAAAWNWALLTVYVAAMAIAALCSAC